MTDNNKRCRVVPSKGFTLAEVLITLLVIGVVAAISVPVMMQNYKKTEVETKLKYSYSIISQLLQYYNAGSGNIMYNIQKAGIYYDGYGVAHKLGRKNLFTDTYRDCRKATSDDNSAATYALGSFCIALIVENNWKIPDDYPMKI